MKKIILIILSLCFYGLGQCQSLNEIGFKNEILHYVISYKWGLIHKDAGEAILSLRNHKDRYNIELSAKTKPWADKVFKVRDTLKSTVLKKSFKPLTYTKISHEGGKYGKDFIKYSYNGATTFADCKRIRIKDGCIQETQISLSSDLDAFDMLSVFYYLRQIDYNKLSGSKSIKATIFSGKRSEIITIRNLGIENITLQDKSTHKSYHIRFNFTTQGGKKTSADMDTWISVDNNIPLQLDGDLPIGKIKCYYTPK